MKISVTQLGKSLSVKILLPLLLLPSLNIQAQLKPVELGRASNVFTILRVSQNQVYANDQIDLVTFIHRQDITLWGGGDSSNGIFRYDISLDGGNSFTSDIGPLNPINKRGRYPQIVGLDPPGITDPRDERFIYVGPTVSEFSGWEGMVSGLAEVTTRNPIGNSTEHNKFINENTYLFSGLCKGIDNEFWTVCLSYDGFNIGDSLFIFKGIYKSLSNDIGWSIYETIPFDLYTGYGGPNMTSPNMQFSPDGETGWIAALGDLTGGSDSVFNPILIPSFDRGRSWEAPIEVDLRTVDFLSDSRSLSEELQDELYLFPTDGHPACAFDFDLTVDNNGNPHFFVVVGSATDTASPIPNYGIRTNHVKLAIDIFSEDGGETWKAFTVSPINAFRTDVGSPDPVSMDNFPQIARNKAGDHIFYSWVDSDTSGYGGSSGNDDPNLRISSLRLTDNHITCPKWITLGDATWDGTMYFPTMAPEVLETRSGYKLPIVSVELLTGGPALPCRFWYFGNDATFDRSDYVAHYSLLNTDSCYFNCNYNNLTAGFEKQIENYQVQFTDTSKTILPILTWNWQFGDGNISADPNPTHTYSTPGTYNVQLIVTTDCDIDATIIPVSVPDSDGDGVPDDMDICAYGDDLKDENDNLIPDDCECQSIDLITASLITQDTVYIIRDQIISADVLQNPIHVLYKAGESITLTSGFEVQENVTFIAVPVGCQQAMGILPKEELQILKENPNKTIKELPGKQK